MEKNRSGLTGPIKVQVEGAPIYRAGRRDRTGEPVTFPGLPAALDWVLQMFERYDLVSGWLSGEAAPRGVVRVIRVREGELLLVGNVYVGQGAAMTVVPDAAAEKAVARLLPARGYHQVVLPELATPLVALRPLLAVRIVNCLERYGYRTVEQVAVLPDAALYDMRSMGVVGITELRGAIATLSVATVSAATVRLTVAQVSELTELLDRLAVVAQAHGEHDLAQRATVFQHLLPSRSDKVRNVLGGCLALDERAPYRVEMAERGGNLRIPYRLAVPGPVQAFTYQNLDEL